MVTIRRVYDLHCDEHVWRARPRSSGLNERSYRLLAIRPRRRQTWMLSGLMRSLPLDGAAALPDVLLDVSPDLSESGLSLAESRWTD